MQLSILFTARTFVDPREDGFVEKDVAFVPYRHQENRKRTQLGVLEIVHSLRERGLGPPSENQGEYAVGAAVPHLLAGLGKLEFEALSVSPLGTKGLSDPVLERCVRGVSKVHV